MVQWIPDARSRMRAAAVELFEERGYARTTAADVAARAGLTERTFFRYFPDKREVLFGDDGLGERLAAAVRAADEGAAPVEAVAAGFDAVAVEFDGRREAVARRARIVAAHAELRERELTKLASWAQALEAALRERGLPGRDAELLAEVSVATFRTAYRRWLEEEAARGLAAAVRESLAGLADLLGQAALRAGRPLPARAAVSGPRTSGERHLHAPP